MTVVIHNKEDDVHNPECQGIRDRMGHSKAAKEKSHQRIVKTAAARFRERGVDGIGVAELMKEADLTHGGFTEIEQVWIEGPWLDAPERAPFHRHVVLLRGAL